MAKMIVIGYEVNDVNILDTLRTLNKRINVFFNGQDRYEPIFGMVVAGNAPEENFSNITIDKLVNAMDKHSPTLKKLRKKHLIPTKYPDPKLYIVDALPGQG